MAGLLQGLPGGPPMQGEGMTTSDDVPPRGTGADDGDVGEEAPNVSPEEQAQYDKFVTDGLDLIYKGGQVRPGILKLLDEDPSDLIKALGDIEAFDNFSPVVALAATTVIIVLQLVRSAGDEKPSGEIIMHGGTELLEELADLSGNIGKKFSDEDANKALMLAMDIYRLTAEQEGLLDTEGLKEDFAEIQAADREGRFFEKVPGMKGFVQ